MKKLLASLALLFYVNILCSQIVIYSAESVGGTDNQWGKKIALDNSGASVILIEYSGSVSLDSTVYLEGIVNSTAIAKYSGANLNWSANIIAEELNDICTDDQNNIYLVGYGSTNGVTFIGPADTITILNSYQGINWDGPYLIKLDSSGHFIYGRYFNHGSGAFTNVSKATSVNSDHSGNVYVAGELQFFFFYDNGDSIRINGPSDKLFVSQFNSSTGSINWAGFAADFGAGTGRGHIKDLCILEDKYIFLTGDVTNKMTFTDFISDSVDITSVNSMHEDIFIAGFDDAGRLLNARAYGGTIKDFALNIAASDTDHIYIGGKFDSPGLVLDNNTIPSAGLAGEFDGFILRLDYDVSTRTWNDIFGVDIGPDGISSVNGLDVDDTHNVYGTGDFDQQLEFGLDVLQPDGNGKEAFFIILDESGNKIVWDKAGNAPGSSVIPIENDEGYDIAVSGIYSACFTGKIQTSNGSFGGIPLSTSGMEDVFIAKIGLSIGVPVIRNRGELIAVSPNPSAGKFKINFNNDGLFSGSSNYYIMDMNGRCLKSEKVTNKLFSVDISTFEDGVYWLSVTNESDIIARSMLLKLN
ncbi:MAG TPA: T9SS type A sorting domain-containing protein [Bacteroidia bacterium]|nr:T9SS type A sorting domain-containing protein [Bacteroidia bacterium]